MPTMTSKPGQLAATYFQAWKAHDWTTLRSIVADDATFKGPLGTAASADEFVSGLQGMAKIMTDVEVRKMLTDDTDAITWFDLHTRVATPTATVNWMHTENGRIVTVRVTFDPREILAAGR
jgi:hypothetical protein